MTPTLRGLTTVQLHRIIAIKIRVEKLQSRIESIAGGSAVPTPSAGEVVAPTKRKYHMTAAHRRKVIRGSGEGTKDSLGKSFQTEQKEGSTKQSGSESQTFSGCEGQMGQGEGGGEEDAVGEH